MPELPEVETVMRGMQIALLNRTLNAVHVRRHDLRWQIPADFSQRVAGRRINAFQRRGKYILIRLSGGISIMLHLGMSGRIILDSPQTPTPHEHVVFVTDDGKRCSFVDPRRFGMIDLVRTGSEYEHRLLQAMGPEPLTPAFTPEALALCLAGKKSPIKTALLDQKNVAGLGNIYVCEALYRARIHPATPSKDLTVTDIKALVPAIKDVLTEAIAAGGSSLKDYVRPEGGLGYFQHAWQVYGRAGQPCPECPQKPQCSGVQHITQAGRSTFFCPIRQKARDF
ncbi:bifunctional DNA-formamidopyrimidine glycosylase/DNA-(apurinic or apyrimidinic site) lyase [Acetobacter cibinongensis]|uniref:Formamidopyrimidine-DNA glycosylase n=1 Tax=Acetobacter cibinongensis TaxID=146475 RepID=A0A1Z5YYF5_9PROT|nr:bifunctional DNA-formamidopyrimidine glycosylase/DNA-(apurinic or apyrimidinic site) lyase [Acetobacter cibinongensis]OUJ04351.1 formamidopyrimidine-DNA glycosylase [Acetobacter cibinongensis]